MNWDEAPEGATHYGLDDGLWNDAWYKLSDTEVYDFVPGRTEFWNIVYLRDEDLPARLLKLIPRP